MQPSTVYCDTCGAANRSQARFCIACGQVMPAASSLPPMVLAGSPSISSSSTGLLASNSLLKQRYRILSRLGQGGMGAVYKASDTQLGDRSVAVKEMSQKGLDPQELVEAADGFKREALMLAGLPHHANLPSIYDHFAEGGRWYLVMDFIADETLEDHLVKAGGKLPVQDVLDIGIQLVTVLDYLHSHQLLIIFRDLKPTNVMCTPNGHLYLIDFGIARNFKQGQAKDTIAYGSAGYAAPEQYGKAQTTPQFDIYSLGATLHHLLSGTDPSQTPFDFVPLTSATIPAGLRTLIAQMVETKVGKRPASMAEVKQQLQRIIAQPAGSQLPPTQYVAGVSLPPTQLAANPPLAQQPSFISPASPPIGTTLYTYRGHSNSVRALAWSSDGRRIASTSDHTVQVWDATTGKGFVAYRGYSDPISALAWSPDGKYLAFSPGRVVQVWNTATDKLTLTYRGYSDPISALAWSARWEIPYLCI